ncbi:hypothetical protein MNBD_DELTA03-466 [hydrothermal vent metagenome]|uniref:DUF4912 domain-containing protein n=1 Tax=hydrothermal vent metagenome TaxID=652676 RepID=A0A3B0W622_9ZZZZ
MKNENMVSQSHFNMPEFNMASSLESPSLPASYGKTSLFLMTVDPYSAHLIWEVDTADMTRLNQKGCRPLIKLHDITENSSQTHNTRTSFEIEINIDDKKGYITLPKAGRTYSAELGFKNAAGHFSTLAQSNSSEAPRDTPAAEPYPDNKSADMPGAPATAGPAHQIPADHITAAEFKAENLHQTIRPLENRVWSDEDDTDKYINAVEIINNPPPGVSPLPYIEIIEMKPSFTSLDYSGHHGELPRELFYYGHSSGLTELSERRFITGISSR